VADVVLQSGGKDLSGWTSVRVRRSLEHVAGDFTLSISAPVELDEGDEAAIRIGRETLLVGYVDRRTVSFSADQHTVEVSGRDKTGDLVDCSADLRKWTWRNISVLDFARQVAAPFGVGVTAQLGAVPAEPVEELSIDPGDSAYEAIERACRGAALLPVADGLGGLVLTRAGAQVTRESLIEGRNLLGGTATVDRTGRFRRYKVRGQHAGSDSLSGATAATVTGEAQDLGSAPARVLIVRAEGNVTRARAKTRAEWEATVRAARAVEVTLTVQGWTQAGGLLWPVNALVHVRSPTLGLDGQMLITGAVFQLDSSTGTTTELTCRLPGAFQPEPLIPRRPKKRGTVALP